MGPDLLQKEAVMSKNGYIYILPNDAFRQYLFKIGRTIRLAHLRASEIYFGETDVRQARCERICY